MVIEAVLGICIEQAYQSWRAGDLRRQHLSSSIIHGIINRSRGLSYPRMTTCSRLLLLFVKSVAHNESPPPHHVSIICTRMTTKAIAIGTLMTPSVIRHVTSRLNFFFCSTKQKRFNAHPSSISHSTLGPFLRGKKLKRYE